MAKVFVTWKQVNDFIEDIVAKSTKENRKFSGVYGIPRGGLVMAAMLSYRLEIPLLTAPAPDCIIIDDIADSGRSLCHYRENDTQFNEYYIATLFYHKRSIVVPDFYSLEKTNEWIVFPWEYDEDKPGDFYA